MGKRGPKNGGPEKFVQAWLNGLPQDLPAAYLREASRELTEMENWMKDQIKYDPQGISWAFEDTAFPLVKKAVRYRYKIYNLSRKIKEIEEKIQVICGTKYGANPQDPAFVADPEVLKLRDEWADLEHDQMGYVWRIKKIHSAVKTVVRPQLGEDDEDPFAEYEYDPAKS